MLAAAVLVACTAAPSASPGDHASSPSSAPFERERHLRFESVLEECDEDPLAVYVDTRRDRSIGFHCSQDPALSACATVRTDPLVFSCPPIAARTCFVQSGTQDRFVIVDCREWEAVTDYEALGRLLGFGFSVSSRGLILPYIEYDHAADPELYEADPGDEPMSPFATAPPEPDPQTPPPEPT